MNVIMPKPGSYVVAISGGVDSRVLLDILHKHSKSRPNDEWKLVVAHLDHGVRTDSGDDRLFVQSLADDYGLPFEYKTVELGSEASEARARVVRYEFLNQARKKSGARAIITAHHQDDLIETAIINMLRGSGRKGVTSLGSHTTLLRPLLAVPKSDLLNYARKNDLVWREDSTNQDDTYLRNYVRHNITPRFSSQDRDQLLKNIDDLQGLNHTLDNLLAEQLQAQDKPGMLTRTWFNNLPHNVAKEILASWLRAHELREFDSKTLERLVINAKAAHSGQQFPVRGSYIMKVKPEHLALELAER